jgi:hypothetical protein
MANAKPDPPDPVKTYNEFIKVIEALSKREGELVQKLTSASENQTADKKRWATELVAVTKALAKLEDERVNKVEALAT